ncbi:Toll-interacting protein B [Fasciola gigantica]|uniref:Toll-interacting protein B n=1 Tax=Fasciola gigantica TaxID=46835 RepID=A0A504WV64_FASGI|nr:Toll-interacting protein B [Fasciola gigantica]
MATPECHGESTKPTLEERRNKCLLCPLPNHFLRTLPYDEELSRHGLVQREDRFLEVGIIQARLVKNYGLTSMNPYCRIRLGDSRYETQTAISSSKHPIWNEVCRLPVRGDSNLLSVVLMDEGLLMSDSKIAWTTIPLPQSLYGGEPIDTWFQLSGKQGQDSEGSIHLTLKIRTVIRTTQRFVPGVSGATVPAVFAQPPPRPAQPIQSANTMQTPAKPISSEDVLAIKEVFPSIADDTIQTLLETHDGNRDEVTSELLRMTNET